MLLYTIVYSVESIRLLLAGREKGGALLFLLAASGASDSVTLSPIRIALNVLSVIDDVVVETPEFDSLTLTFRVGAPECGAVARHQYEYQVLRQTRKILTAIYTSLTQVGAIPPTLLNIAALRCR